MTVDNIQPPTSTEDPGVSGGSVSGGTLTADEGSWSDNGETATYSYQWQRCDSAGASCEDIAGATESTYTTTCEDVDHTVRVVVTAANSEGSTSSTSGTTSSVTGSVCEDGNLSSNLGGSSSSSGSDGSDASSTGSGDVNIYYGDTTVNEASATDAATANGANASRETSLKASFSSNRSKRIKSRYGKRVKIKGRLLNRDGNPIAGAELRVLRKLSLSGRKFKEDGTVKTRSNGRFTYKTDRKMASSTIRFAYQAFKADTEFADTTDVRVDVSARAKLKVKRSGRGGKKLYFTGKLLGGKCPKSSGKLITMQWFNGRKWQAFGKTIRAKKNCKFKMRYRLTGGAGQSIRLKFRARIPSERRSYPFRSGRSNTVSFRFRG